MQLSDKLKIRNTALFDRSLNLFLNLYPAEATPLSSAIGVLVFSQLKDRQALETIYAELDKEIQPLDSDPTNQVDLPNRTLVLVAYHGLCKRHSRKEHLSPQIVNAYLAYASDERWIDSPELALFTHELAQDMQVAQKVTDYFRNSIRAWINQGHIIRSSQSLRVLLASTTDEDALSIFETMAKRSPQSLSIEELDWVVIALSSAPDLWLRVQRTARVEELVEQVEVELSKRLEAILSRSQSDALFHGLVHLIQSGATNDEIKNFIERLGERRDRVVKRVGLGDTGIVLQVNEGALSNQDYISISSLALSLWAMFISGRHQLVGVSSNHAPRLKDLLENGEAVAEKKKVVQSRFQSVVINILALGLISLVEVAVALYVGGATASLDWKAFDIRSAIAVFVALAVTLVLGIISIWRTGTISLALWELPVVKDLRKALKDRSQSKRGS